MMKHIFIIGAGMSIGYLTTTILSYAIRDKNVYAIVLTAIVLCLGVYFYSLCKKSER